MGDITKAFFIAREHQGPQPFRGANHLRLPTHPHELWLGGFRPGDGQRLQAQLTGDWPTGEKQPRPLPKAVIQEVAHHIQAHRHAAQVHEPGYVLQLMAVGAPELHWTLQKISAKAGRYDPLKRGAPVPAAGARGQGAAPVLKSELDNLEIERWERAIHYTLHLVTFDRVGDMAVWLDRYERSTPDTQALHREALVQEPKPPQVWFETTDWQRLPGALIQRLDPEARALVFPTVAQMAGRAWRAAGGPAVTLPFAFMLQLFRESDEQGPHNCVHTRFKADLRVQRSDGRV